MLSLFLLFATVRIQPPSGDAPWRATYTLDRPVSTIEFERHGTFERKGWRQIGGTSRPRKKITIEFPFDPTVPVKDYQLFQPYSDGSVLLYTGHFNPAGGGTTRFVLAPRRGERLIVGGRTFRRKTTWTDTTGEGTFVYFGNLSPIETPHMIAVIDPAVPSWLDRRFREGVPRLFAEYAELTGFKLETRPTVFFSFEAAKDPNSTTWKGGTLPGVIQMHVEAGAKEDRALAERFFKFLAHEAAHMWNGQLFQSAGKNQSWMHEGGADAFAWRAMHRAGLLDDRELAVRQAGDLNRCLAETGVSALDEEEAKGNFGAVYSCGSTLAWLTEAAAHKRDAASDLHTFWRAVFNDARERGGTYDESVYFSELRKLTDEETTQFIDAFVHHAMPDRLPRTVAAFARAGIELEPHPDEMPNEQRQMWAQSALAALMRGDCGRVDITRSSGRMILGGRDTCATIKSALVVDNVEGHRLGLEGDQVYDTIAARCAAGEAVVLGGVPVPCKAKLEPRTPWLGVRKAPGAAALHEKVRKAPPGAAALHGLLREGR